MSAQSRRSFLRRCYEAVAAALASTGLRKTALAAPDFHLHVRYREQTPLDSGLLQLQPGLDGFVNEQYHDRIAALLSEWSTSILQSPQNTEILERALSANFKGFSSKPLDTHPVRPTSCGLHIERLRFGPPSSTREIFLADWRAAMTGFSQLMTAEFQITKIDSGNTGMTTRIRYELVGTGVSFFREQRVGYWLLDWDMSYRIARWEALDEERCRSEQPFFADITRAAFGSTSSYSLQLAHGADYWRTVLDGACGIDIYGHNGVSVGDFDGDGHDDLYICQPAGLPNRLFRNRGDGTFEDVTELSGVGVLENTACALFADFDNDGRQDLVVVRANGPLLFLNEGNGKFREKPAVFEFANAPQGTFTGAAAADYNHDGWLDIYFCVYAFYQGAGQYKYPTPYFAAENGPPNFMLHNNGDGTFRDVTAQCGLDKNNTRYSFCCGWGDSNGDGWPDLYVVNDFGRKNLYRNKGDGTFTDVAREAGVEAAGAGMSICWLDYDNDGFEDLYVANMWTAAGERVSNYGGFQKNAPPEILELYRQHAMGNSLFHNERNAGFGDDTRESRTGMGRWSWSSDAWDFDHDGFTDIYVANGMISGKERQDLNSFFWRQVIAKSPNVGKSDEDYEQGWNAINELVRSGHSWSGYERNVLYANNRNGSFSNVSGAIGLDFSEDSRAFVLADFDKDGRQELLLKNRNAPQLRLMKSTVPDLPPAIAFRLEGTKSNRDGIGAAITIETSTGRQTKLLQAGSGFLSQHSKELFFGLGEAKGAVSATIHWPSGVVQHWKDLPPNHRIAVTEGSEATHVEPFKQPRPIAAGAQEHERLPSSVETWLLAPVTAPDFSLPDTTGKAQALSAYRGKPVLLSFKPARRVLLQETVLVASDDVLAIYNLLFRYLFDQHQDLPLPTSFLIDKQGQIVKVYQGEVDARRIREDVNGIPRSDAERLSKALPFPGVSKTFEFGRNYLSLGSIFFQRGYIEASGEFFQAALRQDALSAEAFYGLGSVYLKLEKNPQAQAAFERAANLKASYPETGPNAWNNLGLLATREGDTPKAVDRFQRALQLDPDHFVALENLGNAYRQQKSWEEARKALERALAIKPADAEANYSLGMVFAQMDDAGKAYDHLQLALKTRPAYPEAMNNLGVLYLRTRQRDEAVAEFEKCIRTAPAFDQSYLNLARVYAIEGDTPKARAILLALLKQHPEHALAQQALAQLR